jgi:hypothetical protein
MSLKSFMKAGDPPTLFSAFLYFDLSFMTWVLLAPLAVLIGKDLHLDAAHKGLMVATPVLAGAFLRVVVGVLVDYVKPRTAGLICTPSAKRFCSAACSAWPGPPLRSPCPWPRAGIRQSSRVWRSASRAPAIPAPF